MKLRFQADNDLDHRIVIATRRLEPTIDFQPAPPEPPESEMQSHCDVFPCHVLIDREFRCGNVREQSLLEICCRNGLLGELRALDFQELTRQDERVVSLTQPNMCMGTVYAKTRELPVWRNNLPMLQFGDEANK